MAIAIFDRVLETSVSSGTGNFTLLGAVANYQSFASTVGVGNLTYYGIIDNVSSNFEIGIGTLIATETLTRNIVLSSSNNGSLVNFAGNLASVFIDVPATKRIDVDSPAIVDLNPILYQTYR